MGEQSHRGNSRSRFLSISGRPVSPPAVLLFLVTEDWYFLAHRLPMACAAQREGYKVHVATHVNAGAADIEKYGFVLHRLNWRRGSLNPIRVFSIIREVRALYRKLAPDLIHHIALQAVVIGSLAATGLSPVRLNALSGLGFGFTSRTPKALIIRPILAWLLRRVLKNRHAAVLVENPDDRAVLHALGVPKDCMFLIPGSGVDTATFAPLPEPQGPMTVAFVGRLLDDKGVRTLIAAHDILAGRGAAPRLLIAGEPDPANPASIPTDEIESWRRQPGVEMLGHVSDIRALWSKAHIAVLPSRREGLPVSLLEAAACGRPIVATDVPGCREVARDGLNALVVSPDDPLALADAMARLAQDGELRRRFGAAGRRLVEENFSSARIGREVVALYDSLLGRNVVAKEMAKSKPRGEGN